MQFLLIFLLINSVLSDCPNDRSSQAPVRLKRDLMCSYEIDFRPVKSVSTPVNVTFRLLLNYFTYDHHESTLSLDNWLTITWVDEYLTWNPKDYEDISSIHLSASEIWKPDLSVYNRADQTGDASVLDSTAVCTISSSGSVVCVPPSHTSALCVADLTRYPFDTQNCTIRYGSWSFPGEHLNINVLKPAVDTSDLEENGEWKLVSTQHVKEPGTYACCPNETYPSISISFVIKRIPGMHSSSCIVPTFVGILMTITSLCLSPVKQTRFYLCCVNLLSQHFHLEYLSWLVPMNGEKAPLLILFARDSLLLCAISIVLTLILAHLHEKKEPTPVWLSTIISMIVSWRVTEYLLSNNSQKVVKSFPGQEDQSTIIDNNAEIAPIKNDDWIILARIIDLICLFIYFITYLVMLITIAP